MYFTTHEKKGKKEKKGIRSTYSRFIQVENRRPAQVHFYYSSAVHNLTGEEMKGEGEESVWAKSQKLFRSEAGPDPVGGERAVGRARRRASR